MSGILAGLNFEQKRAVKHFRGPLLILAGAGSGKTRVITHRIAYLIRKHKVPPSQIMGVTFTNKACQEMATRVKSLLGSDVDGLWIKTFHASCARILREGNNISLLSPHYNYKFTILDEVDQARVIRQTMKELDISSDRFSPSSVASNINRLKNELISPPDFSRKLGGGKKYFWKQKVADIYQEYQRKIRENNALDFGDLLRLTVKLFQNHPQVLRKYRRDFRFILIDEYQDINYAQHVFAKSLAQEHENICVVGDDDQSIFGWRGADPTNILEFEQDFPEATVIKLCRNYRSTAKILEVANSLIENNPRRKEKELFTRRKKGEKVRVFVAGDQREEAEYVASTIKELEESEDVDPHQIAILYRINTLSREVEEALSRYGIPYEVVKGVGFYRRMEVKDVLSYLRALVNPNDDLSMLRIFNKPRRGLGKKTQKAVKEHAQKQGLSFWKAAIELANGGGHLRQKERLKQFVRLFTDLREKVELEVSKLTKLILDKIEYVEYLREKYGLEEAEERVGNVKELIGQMEEFESRENGRGVEGFLEHVALVSDIDCFEDRKGHISLMTLHSAKGLEFDHVFIIGVEENILPHVRSVEEGQVEEERRLCYVGVTRAKERLWLTLSRKRSLYGSRMYNRPSRFINEMPTEKFRQIGVDGDGSLSADLKFSPHVVY